MIFFDKDMKIYGKNLSSSNKIKLKF
jgi:hypothetical protein